MILPYSYAVHLMVILVWWFGKFGSDRQTLCMPTLRTYNHVYYEQCTLNIALFTKLKCPLMCITSQFFPKLLFTKCATYTVHSYLD